MIAATRRWLRRNRNGLAIAAGAIGATYLAGQYILGKISEARERAALDRIAKDNLKRRFAQNQQDCTYTVLALLPTVTENVLSSLPVEQFTHELQQKKQERLARAAGEGAASEISSAPSSTMGGDTASLSKFQTDSFIHTSQFVQEGQQPRPRKSKVQIWNEIKIASITRAFTLIYTLSLLTLLTRIQLNLLGRLNYLTSVISLASPPTERSNSISLEDHDDSNLGSSANFGNDFETNRRYLTFSWFLLHRGYAKILENVRAAVTEVFAGISPTETLTARRLSDLTLEVRKKIEGATEQDRYATRWLPFMLPLKEEEDSVLIESGVITPPSTSSATTPDPTSSSGPNRSGPTLISTSGGPLRRLLDETADLIDSPTFTRIHTLILNTLFSHLIDIKVAEQAFPRPTEVSNSDTSGRIQEVESAVTVVPAEPRVKLATILAVLTRQAHAIGNNGSDPPNDYVQAIDRDVKELESFAAVIYANNLAQSVEESRPRTADSTIKSADGTGVSDVGVESEGEMLESKLEGAWSKVMGSSFSSSHLSFEIIVVLVGPSEEKFEAHEQVLTKIQYFQKCIAGNFKEAKAKQIKLPEDVPGVLEQILEYMYRGQCTLSEMIREHHDGTDSLNLDAGNTIMILLEFYVVADKWCLESPINDLKYMYRKSCTCFYVASVELAYLTDQGPPNSMLRKFAREQIAWEMCKRNWDVYKEAHADMFKGFIDVSVAKCKAVLEKAFDEGLTLSHSSPAAELNGCKWHTHLITPKRADHTAGEKGDGRPSKRPRIEWATGSQESRAG